MPSASGVAIGQYSGWNCKGEHCYSRQPQHLFHHGQSSFSRKQLRDNVLVTSVRESNLGNREISESVTSVTTFSSALEDIETNTLNAIPGSLRRLEYLSDLRSPSGTYIHWGLARTHGDQAASKALARAHQALLSHVLSTPLRSLLEDLEDSSHQAGLAPDLYAQRLFGRGFSLLPPDPGAGSAGHLNSVLVALSGLAKVRQADATRPTS